MTAATATLHWNRNGEVACSDHIYVGGSLYQSEGWTPIPPSAIEANAVLADEGARLSCDVCHPEAL